MSKEWPACDGGPVASQKVNEFTQYRGPSKVSQSRIYVATGESWALSRGHAVEEGST